MITVKIKFFGFYKRFGTEASVEVERGITVSELKKIFEIHLSSLDPSSDWDRSVIKESAFASEDKILVDGERLSSSCALAVLPPVCGG